MSKEFASLIIRLFEMDDDERQRTLDEMKSSISAARKVQFEEFKADEEPKQMMS
jgi:hypothetical protein